MSRITFGLMDQNRENAVRVKVCGLTRLKDVAACESLGVDYVGFNFWPKSKRHISPSQARDLVAATHRAIPVGVFVNPTVAEVMDAIHITDIQYLQLHGDESWDLIDLLPLPVIKAIPANRLSDWGGLKQGWPGNKRAITHWLIDTPAGSGYGGTGRTFDWSLLANAVSGESEGLPLPFFLAGGLGPDNVAEAAFSASGSGRGPRIFGVDLNSKVETAPGIKDHGLIRDSLRALGRSV